MPAFSSDAFAVIAFDENAFDFGTTPTPTPTVTALGKYQPEHDSALLDLAAATGFSLEHASALSDLASAGV